tara:strand:+ start:446 stop:1447 length:1002 start_codon:yes stop_codon:yes gene_type:complete
VSESTTEPKVTDIDSALNSILDVPTETIEEAPEEEIRETDEISAEAEVADEVETEEEITEQEAEEIEASDSEDDEDQIEDASPEEPQRYTVKVDGQETEVTLEDLKQGYSGQKYVQQGMQDASAQKKEAEAVYTALTNERQQLAELYQSLQQGNVAAPPEKPTKELFDADPIGYMKQNLEYEEQKGKYDMQMAQLQQVSQQSSEAEATAKQAYLKEQMQILQREIPDFADSKRATALKEQLVNYGTAHYGYTTDEISQITDHRAIKVLHDAMKYQDIVKGKSQAKTKTKSAKPMLKPGAKKMATPNAKVRSRQQAKLKDSGSIDDALNLILNS